MRMKILMAAGAWAVLAAMPALASEKSDVLKAVDEYVQAFNKSDPNAFAAMCMNDTVIIDSVPPHVWQGANACSEWWKALDDASKKQGMNWGVVSRGKPMHLGVDGDHAYAVFPSMYKYRLKGKPAADRGVWTFALVKQAAGWRIAGWSWADQR